MYWIYLLEITLAKVIRTEHQKNKHILGKLCFDLTNKERERLGLPILLWDDELFNVALVHSKNMATGMVQFGHGGFKKRASQLKRQSVNLFL